MTGVPQTGPASAGSTTDRRRGAKRQTDHSKPPTLTSGVCVDCYAYSSSLRPGNLCLTCSVARDRQD